MIPVKDLRNNTVTSLHLSARYVDNLHAMVFGAAAASNTSLTYLDLSINELADNAMQCVASALRPHPALTELNLSNNTFGDRGVQALAGILKSTKTLTKLFLGNNRLTDPGVMLLSDILKHHNTSLVTLEMPCCAITESGILALAAATAVHASLTAVDVARNKLGDVAAAAWAACIRANPRLKRLTLPNNVVGDRGAIDLLRAYQEQKTISYINLDFNRLGYGWLSFWCSCRPVPASPVNDCPFHFIIISDVE